MFFFKQNSHQRQVGNLKMKPHLYHILVADFFRTAIHKVHRLSSPGLREGNHLAIIVGPERVRRSRLENVIMLGMVFWMFGFMFI